MPSLSWVLKIHINNAGENWNLQGVKGAKPLMLSLEQQMQKKVADMFRGQKIAKE